MSGSPTGRGAQDVDRVAASAGYRELIDRLQRRARETQARAARSLNTELVMLYWSIGHDILEQQNAGGWGDDIVGRIAEDLRAATGSARGLSRRNVFYMRRFAEVWSEPEFVQPVAAQIGWTHHQVLIDAFATEPGVYRWYAAKASAGRWSRRHLQAQIHLQVHEREGAAVTNFAAVLPAPAASRRCRPPRTPTSSISSSSRTMPANVSSNRR